MGRLSKRLNISFADYSLNLFPGIGGAGVVAIYKLGFPELTSPQGQSKAIGGTSFRSDVIFEEIRERAAQVCQMHQLEH